VTCPQPGGATGHPWAEHGALGEVLLLDGGADGHRYRVALLAAARSVVGEEAAARLDRHLDGF
jgi:hypothetical protein